MNWYVVYTKPKWEKKVADQLLQIGITSYCPMITQMRQWSDRKKKVTVPLFNSYVFVQLSDVDRNEVFKVTGIVRYLFWLGKPAIVRNEEIEIIRKSLNNEIFSEVLVESYKKGDRIIVDNGAFKNQVGIVQEVTNTQYVLVLEALGCVLKVKLK